MPLPVERRAVAAHRELAAVIVLELKERYPDGLDQQRQAAIRECREAEQALVDFARGWWGTVPRRYRNPVLPFTSTIEH